MVARSVLSVLLVSLSVVASPLKLAKRELIPDFVLANAPISHLWSEESWWPSDIAVHLTHVVPEVDFDDVASSVTFTTISTLASDVFLTSKDDVLTQPAWMTSAVNEPDSNGHSGAPATIICVEKEGGIFVAFFFYFYSFNSGGKVLDIEFDDHIGDWEHSMVRFVNGEPSVVYLSAHSGGSAFTFDTMQTTSGRPTTYIAGGTHANYATPGNHYHDLPPPLLFDMADAGLLWDPTLNFRGYWFDNSTGTFSIAGGADIGGTEEGSEGVGWLNFEGMWGDEQYPILEHGQYCVELGSLSECRFSSGPTGPIAKNLGRTAVCEHEDDCTIQTSL